MISNYSELQASIATWMKRADLAALIPDFIALAETRIKTMVDPRLYETTVTLSTSPSSDTIALPSDFKAPIALWLADINPIEQLTQKLVQGLPFNDTPSRPLYWAIDGASIRFQSPADAAYPIEFRYQQTFSLSGGNPTNYILTAYPNVYLFSTLVEAHTYVQNQEESAVWDGRFRDAVAECNSQEASRDRYVALATEFGQINQRRFNIFRGY